MTSSPIYPIEVALPFHAAALLDFLQRRAIPSVEAVDGARYARSVRLPGGFGMVELDFTEAIAAAAGMTSSPSDATTTVFATVQLPGRRAPGKTDTASSAGEVSTVRGGCDASADTGEGHERTADNADVAEALRQCAHLIGADVDAPAIDAALRADIALGPSVADAPGLRVPGTVDGPEILIRALVGQQVSVVRARGALHELTVAANEEIGSAIGASADHSASRPVSQGADAPAAPTAGAESTGPEQAAGQSLTHRITHAFPSPAALAALGVEAIRGPRRRASAIFAAAADMAAGKLRIDHTRSTEELTADLVARPGIGPWTAGYVAMRALRDADVLLTGDLALRRGAAALGIAPDNQPVRLAEYGRQWAPYRSFAGMYLWRAA